MNLDIYVLFAEPKKPLVTLCHIHANKYSICAWALQNIMLCLGNRKRKGKSRINNSETRATFSIQDIEQWQTNILHRNIDKRIYYTGTYNRIKMSNTDFIKNYETYETSKPNDLHTTRASFVSKPRLQTVPHCPLCCTSTRPSLGLFPSTSLTKTPVRFESIHYWDVETFHSLSIFHL